MVLKGTAKKNVSHCVCFFPLGVFFGWKKWRQKSQKNTPAPVLHKSIAREAEPQRALVRWGVWSRQFLWMGKMGEKIGGEISEFPEVF